MLRSVTYEAHFADGAAAIAWSMITTPSEWTAWMPDLQMVLRMEEGDLLLDERIITYSAIRSRPSEHHWIIESVSSDHLDLRMEQEMRLDRLSSRAISHLVHRWTRSRDVDGELLKFTIEWEFTGFIGRLFLNRIARSTFTATAQRTTENLVNAVVRLMQESGQLQPEEE